MRKGEIISTRVIRTNEANRMFKRLKGMFGKKQPVTSYNQRETRERCIQHIMSIHRMAIVTSGEEREIGLEDAVLNKMALEGFCEWITNCPDCFSRAAMTFDYIANFHPFAEGNKRTAFQLALAMLRDGGYEPNDNDVTFKFIKDVASGMYDREEVEDWLRCNTHVSSP